MNGTSGRRMDRKQEHICVVHICRDNVALFDEIARQLKNVFAAFRRLDEIPTDYGFIEIIFREKWLFWHRCGEMRKAEQKNAAHLNEKSSIIADRQSQTIYINVWILNLNILISELDKNIFFLCLIDIDFECV